MEDIGTVTLGLAFIAGILSFISPCTLPLFPVYLSYITGISVKEMQKNVSLSIRFKVMSHSVVFLLGVSSVFIGLGIGVTVAGQWIQGLLVGTSGELLQRFTGIFLVFMGLVISGVVRIDSLMKDKKWRYTQKPVGYVGSFFVGVGFSAGWTPCIGPIFASILVLSASNPTQGILYTLVYSVGFAVPFLLLSFFVGTSKWLNRYSSIIMRIGGVAMIAIGLLFFFGWMNEISIWLLRFIEGTWFEQIG